MTLLVPMYHRASAGRYGNSSAMLDAHFAHIAEHCRCVLPGEALDADRLNVCLSFDDGYFDFHEVVFPLLRKHGLRALLAVPLAALRESIDVAAPVRLRACAERTDDCSAGGGYCTWTEIERMAATGTVSIAAHGFTHRRLDRDDVDLHAEIVVPQTMLAARLGRPVDSFVLPYGRFSPAAIDAVRRHYRYVFRIGSADNAGWDGRMTYRIDADELAGPGALFTRRRLAAYGLRRRWNTWRAR